MGDNCQRQASQTGVTNRQVQQIGGRKQRIEYKNVELMIKSVNQSIDPDSLSFRYLNLMYQNLTTTTPQHFITRDDDGG